MSDNKMVIVPREPTPAMLKAADVENERAILGGSLKGATAEDIYCAMVDAAPAEQHQGEPVALPARKPWNGLLATADNLRGEGWNACLDEIAKLGPLYTRPVQGEPVARVEVGADRNACVMIIDQEWLRQLKDKAEHVVVHLYPHADPGEVERLRAELAEQLEIFGMQEEKIDTLRAQLAELDALLREIHDGRLSGHDRWLKIEAALSASAEPSAQSITNPNADCAICRDLGYECMTCEEQRKPSAPVDDPDDEAGQERVAVAAMPGPSTEPHCKTCNDEGAIDDGELTHSEGGIPFENGPIKCITPCPDCAAAPPVEHDDPVREALRAFVGAAYPVARQINERGYNWSEAYLDEALALARSALQHKPSPLVAQLQADLTERDELIDQLRSGFVFETGPYQVEMSEEQWTAALDVFENYNMGDEQHFVFLEEQGRGVISEILIAVGVARAPDADEVAE